MICHSYAILSFFSVYHFYRIFFHLVGFCALALSKSADARPQSCCGERKALLTVRATLPEAGH